jgi:Methyltransferase domain
MLVERFPHMQQMSVLDLGGTAGAWRVAPILPARLVLLNVDPPGDLPGAEAVIGDACDPPPRLRDERFDLVFSNSLIEHVGGHWRRQALAEVVRSVADHYWVQTPYRYFPVEPHYVGPLFQFVPLAARGRLIARWPIGSLATVKDPAVGVAQAQQTELLSRTEMRGYFPDGIVLHERILGATKSLIAVR